MNGKNIGYWLTTGLVSAGMLASGVAYLSGAMEEAMVQHLGFPAAFVTVLGTWKLLGAVALVVPGFARVKEWAYAGFFFTFTGAGLIHLSAGDGFGAVVAPAVFAALLLVSYVLRPDGAKVDFGVPALRTAAA